MKFVWDERKNKTNQLKHNVSFETAKLVFEDPMQLNLLELHEGSEERWQTLGFVKGVLLLLVAHTLQETAAEEVVRIISARKATKAESRKYEQAL